MSNFNLIAAISVNTVVSIGIAMFWYSYYGFGRLYVDSFFGGQSSHDKRQRRHSDQIISYISLLSPLLYNVLLIFLINNVYAPHSFNDILAMSFVLTGMHYILELPHIGYEDRSYTALLVHTGYHFLQTMAPLLIIQNFFSMPRLANISIKI